MLSTRISLRCLYRTWLAGAAMTTRGMQHLGFLYALNPGLEALYSDARKLAEARSRYLAHINTHPFMAPLLAGFLLALETRIAQGLMQPQSMRALTRTTAATLSAVGDSFFSGTALATWALSASLCIIMGMIPLAAWWTLFLFALLMVFRVWTFFVGLREGILVLQRIRRMDLINWGDRLKLINALLLTLLLWEMASQTGLSLWWDTFFLGAACIAGGILLVSRAHVPRILLAATVLAVLHLA